MSQKGTTVFAKTRWTRALFILAFVGAACSTSSAPATADRQRDGETSPGAPRTYALGGFPEFPQASLPGATAEGLQAELDEVVEEGTFTGVTAAVIVADRGSWAGAAGSADGMPLTPDSRTPTHSSNKTIVAAESFGWPRTAR
jgi:hypothetical protein